MVQLNKLSNREWEVVKLLLQGKSNKLIALSLGISERTVEFHLKNIYAKFQVNSRIELILKLGNATGQFETEDLRHSTVAGIKESIENRDRLNSWTGWATSVRGAISIRSKELRMKTLLNLNNLLMLITSLLLLFVNWLAFHDIHEAHTVRDWLMLSASVLVFLKFAKELRNRDFGQV
jgi:DNA-binding CsgD family transcriptional regulator